ncbi:hypothetical protein BDF20DRAFT_902180 [Mycotypha africana]|uniref:uncharacterized protein n=1 Tax=Mycotypha africana TaxID=64632 RepID=UPI002301A734|nr:uncharacterized protein BDF20DRAFT_902180 [Mycotypha africana]KAI8967177.1 hypothetical protein BDF20DRAFT_902180 [Mycotypha africana]
MTIRMLNNMIHSILAFSFSTPPPHAQPQPTSAKRLPTLLHHPPFTSVRLHHRLRRIPLQIMRMKKEKKAKFLFNHEQLDEA